MDMSDTETPASHTMTHRKRWRDFRCRCLIAWWRAATGLAIAGTVACTESTDDGKLPPDIQDPAVQHTPSGAMARYRGSLALVPLTVDNLSTLTGLLTDELMGMPAPANFSYSPYTEIDSRQDLAGFGDIYGSLHYLRSQSREARGFLGAYAPDSSRALTGHLFAIEGFADVLLAETFCSGIPLSTVDFAGDYTLSAGLTSADVYHHALALLDSATTMVGDSARIANFVAVERGRSLLALSRYTDAAAAVSAVPDDFKYQVSYSSSFQSQVINGVVVTTWDRLLARFYRSDNTSPATPTAGDNEGGIGLNYLSSGDPRTPTVPVPGDPFGTKYFPAKYAPDGPVTLTLADGIEARLIEAEVSLKLQPGSGDWLIRLNALRTDGAFDTQPNANNPSQMDTLWHRGSGGVPGLGPLSDPGAPRAREDLLFRERAFWLYLTSHRQGDLRRLIQQYGRSITATYPSGPYMGGGAKGTYGNEIVVPVPDDEKDLNPKYAGCIDHAA